MTTGDLVAWGFLLLIGIVAAAAILLIVSSARGRRRSSEEIVFASLVIVGAIVWPQAATHHSVARVHLSRTEAAPNR